MSEPMTPKSTCWRKKPVVVEAWLVSDLLRAAANDFWGLPSSVIQAYERGDITFLPGCIDVRTEEGVMRAVSTDMLICGIRGELYPCKPDIFEATYERA